MVSGYNGRTLSHSIDGRTLKHDDTQSLTTAFLNVSDRSQSQNE